MSMKCAACGKEGTLDIRATLIRCSFCDAEWGRVNGFWVESKPPRCMECGGDGKTVEAEPKTCLSCQGTGREGGVKGGIEPSSPLPRADVPPSPCKMCNGVGFYVSLPGDVISPCPGCCDDREDREWISAIRTTGVPGQRDTGSPCLEFRPGKPRGGDCEGDGHYLCDQCKKHSTRLTDEMVDSGSSDPASVDDYGERS